MDNRQIADILNETARLMELHGANEFKSRSMKNAAFNIGRLGVALQKTPPDEMEKLNGIGKGISQKISEILSSGTLAEYEQYLADTPQGVIEIMQIKGLGPKKVALLWKELGIESPGELLYACNENRLISLKGFGEKTQDQVRQSLEFMQRNSGFYHYASLDTVARECMRMLRETGLFTELGETGTLRRKCETGDRITCIAASERPLMELEKALSKLGIFHALKGDANRNALEAQVSDAIPFTLFLSSPERYAATRVATTGSELHLDQLKRLPNWEETNAMSFGSETAFYASLGLQFIEPELREGEDEIEIAAQNKLPALVELADLKGCLHNHSTYSDGMHTLEEMATACRDRGLEYFGICDHSKSAFYANGLQPERVKLQQDEIRQLNRSLAPFTIFSGIESDILPDGSLDYDDEILDTFDFVVASVHSGLRMDEKKATDRILKAVSNPFTTILGHPTGRLLLARPGYPLDHRAVIDACAHFGVVIELNASPYRLDLDWRWIRYALEKNVMISINPDAHQVEGIDDMQYGVYAARKGRLTAAMTFNALGRDAVAGWFAQRRKRRL